jgi:hypothetical protein
MKIMIKFTVLFATLLLLTGFAFAGGDCHYYEYTYTGLDIPDADTYCVELCFSYGDHSGTHSGFCFPGNLALFFDSMNKQALLYYPGDAGGVEVGYLKFHGSPSLNVFTGILYCNTSFADRYTVRGHIVDHCTDR